MEKGLVSCLCPTYNRVNYIDELVYFFINQTYENKELIILNDNKNINLKYDHPNVKIINKNIRYNTLGEKRNDLIKYAKGEYVMFWDDDDVYYKNYIEKMINNHLLNQKNKCTYNKLVGFIDSSQYHLDMGVTITSGYRLSFGLYDKKYVVNKLFNKNLNIGEDNEFKGDINSVNNNIFVDEILGVYRFLNDIEHTSEPEHLHINNNDFQEKKWNSLKDKNNFNINHVIKPKLNQNTKKYYK